MISLGSQRRGCPLAQSKPSLSLSLPATVAPACNHGNQAYFTDPAKPFPSAQANGPCAACLLVRLTWILPQALRLFRLCSVHDEWFLVTVPSTVLNAANLGCLSDLKDTQRERTASFSTRLVMLRTSIYGSSVCGVRIAWRTAMALNESLLIRNGSRGEAEQ